ncbi:MAG: hypothetical protein ACE5ID_04485 [Acidobacteriota bacterium]
MTPPATRAAAVVVLLLAACAATRAEPPPDSFMQLAEVSAGQQGHARTVMKGRTAQIIPLEILGVAPSFAGPGRDMILARLLGDTAQRTGVVAGMSGSPVTIGGRLLGALSLRIGSFTSEPIAGITPIQQMLAIPNTGPQEPAAVSGNGGRYALERLLDAARSREPAAGQTSMVLTPVALSGLNARVQEPALSILREVGLGPVSTAVAAMGGSGGLRPLRGGDSVAAVLVQGDMIIAATGTTTLVAGKRVLAFGHPLTGAGPADYPMARAEVLVTVASLAGSFKMVRIGEVVGAFHQDRSAGLAGRLGDRARAIHLDLALQTDGPGPLQHQSYDLVRSPVLTPALLEAILGNAFSSARGGASRGTLRMKGSIRLDGMRSLDLDHVFAGDAASPPVAFQAARLVATLVRAIMVSPGGLGPDLALDLEAQLLPQSHIFRLEEVRLLKSRSRPGDQLDLIARLRDLSSGRTRTESFSLPVPVLPQGSRLQVLVGDAAAANQADGFTPVSRIRQAEDLPAVLRILGSLRSTSGLYCRLTRPSPGLLLGTVPLPDLPPSVALILGRDRSSSERLPLQESLLSEESRTEPGVVRGARRLSVEID